MINKIYELPDTDFRNLIYNSLNIGEVLFKLGYTTKGNSWGYSQVKQRMTDLNIKFSEFKGKSVICNNQNKVVNKETILKENCKHTRAVLRRFIINNNLLQYKCSICGCTEWNNKTLSLELDHINGINNDNRIENLRFLCPNCHSQTATYGSRNQKITDSVYDITEELRNLVISTYNQYKNKRKVYKTLDIKRKVIDIIINDAGLYRSNQKYIIRYDKDMNEIMRFGSIAETCKYLINSNEVTTKKYKTCRATFLRNHNLFWKNSYWKIMDA